MIKPHWVLSPCPYAQCCSANIKANFFIEIKNERLDTDKVIDKMILDQKI